MAQAVVATKSAWYSKINWIAFVTAFLVSVNEILNQILPILPPTEAHDVTIALSITGAILTIIAKTFYTTTVTPSSAVKAPTVSPEQAVTASLNIAQL